MLDVIFDMRAQYEDCPHGKAQVLLVHMANAGRLALAWGRHNPSDFAKFGAGLAITGIAFVPFVGLPSSIILSIVEANGGFDNYYESFDRVRVINGYSAEKCTMIDQDKLKINAYGLVVSLHILYPLQIFYKNNAQGLP
jgi:hypothetical protein